MPNDSFYDNDDRVISFNEMRAGPWLYRDPNREVPQNDEINFLKERLKKFYQATVLFEKKERKQHM